MLWEEYMGVGEDKISRNLVPLQAKTDFQLRLISQLNLFSHLNSIN